MRCFALHAFAVEVVHRQNMSLRHNGILGSPFSNQPAGTSKEKTKRLIVFLIIQDLKCYRIPLSIDCSTTTSYRDTLFNPTVVEPVENEFQSLENPALLGVIAPAIAGANFRLCSNASLFQTSYHHYYEYQTTIDSLCFHDARRTPIRIRKDSY